MKLRFCIGIILLLSCLAGLGQTKYEVTTNKSLNVRKYANIRAPIMGSLESGTVIEVYEISNGWAKIRYGTQHAYVSAKFIRERADLNDSMKHSESLRFSQWKIRKVHRNNIKWIVYAIFALSCALVFFRKRRDDSYLDGILYIGNWIVLLITGVLEVIYIIMIDDSPIWFCLPDTVGWFCSIINFLLFGYIVYNQLRCFLDTLSDIEYNSSTSCSTLVGFGSWFVCGIGMIITELFSQNATVYIAVVLGICQLIQIIAIFVRIMPDGGFLNALLYATIYLCGSVAMVLVLLQFIVLLVIVVVVGTFLLGVLSGGGLSAGLSSGGGSGSSVKTCNNCRFYNHSNGTCDNQNITITHPSTTSGCHNYWDGTN